MIVGVSKTHAMAPVTSLESMISSAVTSLLSTQLIVAIICTAVALALVFVFTKSIIQPVRQVAERMEELAGQGGDLTQNIHVHSHAELIQLSEAFNLFKERVRELLTKPNSRVHRSLSKVEKHSATPKVQTHLSKYNRLK
jgi:Signal transduction histidine kinase